MSSYDRSGSVPEINRTQPHIMNSTEYNVKRELVLEKIESPPKKGLRYGSTGESE